jgi:hypothetical protein
MPPFLALAIWWCILRGLFSRAITRRFEQTKCKDTTTMTKDNVIDLKKPEPFITDPITDIFFVKEFLNTYLLDRHANEFSE